MSRLHNPNIRRFGLPLAVTAALLGGTACTADSPPDQVPSITNASPYNHKPNKEKCETDPRKFSNYGDCLAKWDDPFCVVKADVNGLSVTFGLNVTNGSKEGVYDVEKAKYDYGDGSTEDNGDVGKQPHTYAQAGRYAVGASMVMKVGVARPNVEAPFNDGHTIPCVSATVTLG